MRDRLVCGLDIGTTKTCAVIAEISGDLPRAPEARILGVGRARTSGMRRGVVRDIDEATRSVTEAVAAAERMAGFKVDGMYVGIAGEHVRAITSPGVVNVTSPEIRESDVQRVIEVARAVVLPPDSEILHTLPQEYLVDRQRGISDPVGMTGTRLEVDVFIVTMSSSVAQNLRKSVERAGYHVTGFVLEPLAASYATLTEDEKELGVALVELGGGSTDLAIFHDGKFRHVGTFGFAGAHVTSDIAQGVSVTQSDAEKLKERYGLAYEPLVDPAEMIELPGTAGQGPRQVQRELLAHIIHMRLEEILSMVSREIEREGYVGKLAAGIVLTGGTAQLAGVVELAREVFVMPVRLGMPGQALAGSLTDAVEQPRFSTATGLALYGMLEQARGVAQAGARAVTVDRVLGSVKRWLNDFF
ncbi:MAG: cell division protein FtsA [Gemmatimonadetes bacterium]|nr:cell division protein FtsA [Gemmatimonadota bacterium]